MYSETHCQKPSLSIKTAETKLAALLGDTHWHAAYGIYVCDRYLPSPNGSEAADPLGIHSHDDGLIHIHPFVPKAAGTNARLGLCMDNVKISISKTRFTYSPRLSASSGVVGGPEELEDVWFATACKGVDGAAAKSNLSLYVWDGKDDSTADRYTTNFANIRLRKNAVYAFVIAPEGVKVPKPPSVEALATPADVPTGS